MNTNKTDKQPPRMARGRRRSIFAAGACVLLALPRLATPHGIGIVNPAIAMPDNLPLLLNDGKHVTLGNLLQERRTLLQLMFTGCSETCPLQGALFAALGAKFATALNGKNQMLSVSIDPMDDPRSLSSWLTRFGAGRGWIAAVPSSHGIDLIRTLLQGGRAGLGTHSSQVFFIDESQRLIWRTEDFPSTEIVVQIGKRNGWVT